MNYNEDKSRAFMVESLGLDANGNSVKRLTFFRKNCFGIMDKYKTVKTNEQISNLSADEIIRVLG